MATESTYMGKVTLLKLFAGSSLVIILVAGAVFLMRTPNTEPVSATDTNTAVSKDSLSQPPQPPTSAAVAKENERATVCADGSDCAAPNEPSSQVSAGSVQSVSATESGTPVATATSSERIAIQEEGVPAVAEKPAKSKN